MCTLINTSVGDLAWPIVLLLILGSCCTLTAQIGSASLPSAGHVRLELVVTRVQIEAGERGGLTIRFINDGDASVSLPEPTRFCGDSRDGFVMVYSKPLHPSEGMPLGGTGCVVDKVARGDILTEAAQWITIAPRAHYEFTEPLNKAVNTSHGDRYEITARYFPAHVSQADMAKLEERGIHLLQATLQSVSLILQTNPSD